MSATESAEKIQFHNEAVPARAGDEGLQAAVQALLARKGAWVDRGTGRRRLPDCTSDATVADLSQLPPMFSALGW